MYPYTSVGGWATAWVAVVLALFSAVVPASPPAGWTFLGFDEALKQAAQEQRRVFLYFGREGCPFCEKTNREGFSDPRVAERYRANYLLTYVDSEGGKRLRLPSGERITEMELGARLKVFGTPMFFFLEPDGSPVVRAPGYQSAKDLLLLDRYVNEGHYRRQTLAEFKEDPS